ncbi:transcription elongation protein SprT [Algoriphagus kandeliae]|uniref:Transcription elongation protein SprT n=1 Tax=Algoriphagus kandeliae TaxID=2562278 RepID=A0A4Y9QMS3_9BACT|nr:SprT-like domain-containing protein [Algoriphagus kandeliae]TFV93487.1 transcription elongation protein SprT [Algoriphagus kandeliae]
MDSAQKLHQILQQYLPPKSIDYCLELWKKNPFNFSVTRSRKSKFGDFRWKKDHPLQTITINGDLNPYQFLITFIHEVAHLHAFVSHGLKISPHGNEWKRTFQELMHPLLRKEVFPMDILIPLSRHMRNPKATSVGDLFLTKELSKYNTHLPEKTGVFLADIQPERVFELNGRKFRKKETRRTRVLCEEISTGKRYLISQMAQVKLEI